MVAGFRFKSAFLDFKIPFKSNFLNLNGVYLVQGFLLSLEVISDNNSFAVLDRK